MLKTVAIEITTTTPYQKARAYELAITWSMVSSSISCWKLYACVKLEKSTPESFKGTSDDDPLLMDMDMSILTKV
jgi:hypothetical protein